MRASYVMLMAACSLGLVAHIASVTSQTLSLSLASNSSQLFCYLVPPPASPMQCAVTQQYRALTSFDIITAQASPFNIQHSHQHNTAILYPKPLAFTTTNGSEVVFASNAMIVVNNVGDFAPSEVVPANDVWASSDQGKLYGKVTRIVCSLSAVY